MPARVFIQLGQRLPLVALGARTPDATRDSPTAATDVRSRRFLSQGVALLTGHLIDPPGLVALAQRVGTKERRLTQVFRQQVGLTADEYLQQLGLECGRGLLRDTDPQVQLIADRVG